MGKLYSELDERLIDFIKRQHIFFVASAPSGTDGHVNLSPKGLDSFRILNANRVAYQDIVSSGAETIAHLRQNGRMTIMFCAFEGPPKILRLYGHGEVFEPGSPNYDALADQFPKLISCRSIIQVEVTRIADSCGYGVPLFEFQKHRDSHIRWAEQLGPEGLKQYRNDNNLRSIDGLPALEYAD